MAGNVRVVLNHAEIARLLRGEGEYRGVKEDLRRRADAVAEQAGPGNVVEEGGSRARARFAVVTETPEAMLNEARHRTLTRAVDAAR